MKPIEHPVRLPVTIRTNERGTGFSPISLPSRPENNYPFYP